MQHKLLLVLIFVLSRELTFPPTIACADAARLPPLADDHRRSTTANEFLDRKLAERETLNREIQQLRLATGRLQHVALHVSVAELSWTKLRAADIAVDRVNTKLLRENGLAGLIAAGSCQ